MVWLKEMLEIVQYSCPRKLHIPRPLIYLPCLRWYAHSLFTASRVGSLLLSLLVFGSNVARVGRLN